MGQKISDKSLKQYNDMVDDYKKLCNQWRLAPKKTVDQINRANVLAQRITAMNIKIDSHPAHKL